MSQSLLAAARALCARLPEPGSPAYATYHSRLELDALRRALDEHERSFTRREIALALENVGAPPALRRTLDEALSTLR